MPGLRRSRFQWFRFRLSTFLGLVAGLCFVLSQQVQIAQRQMDVASELRSLGGAVAYDYEFDANSNFIPNAKSPWPDWILNRLGVNALHSIVSVELSGEEITEELLQEIGNLDRLVELVLLGMEIDDSTIRHLCGLRRLRYIDLTCNDVQDSGLAALSEIRQLESINLQHQSSLITNNGLHHLSNLTKLKELKFYTSAITDDGLIHFETLKNLRVLWLCDSNVTDSGIAELQKYLPDCQISR